MSKTISAAMQTHLQEEVTSLATCWSITRTDGVEFFFTDHDDDIVFEGNRYEASSGYQRTAIENDSTMSVDNLNVQGIFDSSTITEQDVRAGLFDFAEVRVFLVNWQDLTNGDVKLRRGRFGEVALTDSGIFKVELRGMMQSLSQRIVRLYQPECRVDLGDTKCKVPVDPPLRTDNTAYNVGDFIRVPTAAVAPIVRPLALTNPGFDTGDLTGWTILTGTFTAKTSEGSVLPQAGTHFGSGNISSAFEIRQDFDLTTTYTAAEIDTGALTFDGSVYQDDTFGDQFDTGAYNIEALDSSGAVVSTLFDSGFAVRGTGGTWFQIVSGSQSVPATTRSLRFRLRGLLVFGSTVNVAFDTVEATVTQPAGAGPSQEQYENRIYECTVAGTSAASQPTYDTTVDANTVDGTATFTARQAWMRDAVVDTVVSNKEFTLNVNFDEVRAVDDWFNGGAVEFQVGSNTGHVLEVRDWVQNTRTITLFLPESFTVVPGDPVRLYPGCDKRSTTCIDKFVIPNSTDFTNGNIRNFRGEPFVPGQDELTRSPDAKSA